MSLLLALLLAQADAELVNRKPDVAVRIQTELRRGSGLVVRTHPLTVLTCFHVVQNESKISIDFPSRGLKVPVTAVAGFPLLDIAFLRADAPGYQAESPLAGNPASNMFVTLLGFGKRRGKHLTTTDLKVSEPRTQIRSLASIFNYDVTADFWVVDLDPREGKGFVKGDSGGPIFGPKDVFLGIAAGRFDRSDDEEHSNFALIPPAVPADALFVEVSKGTRGELPYNGAPVHYAYSTEIVGTSEVSSPNAAGSTCGEAVSAALEQLGLPPVALQGVSPACQKAWAGLFVVERELRAEYADATALADLALRSDRAVGYSLRAYQEELDRRAAAFEVLWPHATKTLENYATLEKDARSERKVAAKLVRAGELFTDKLLDQAFRLSSLSLLRPGPLPASVAAEVRSYAAQKRELSTQALELALSKKGTTDASEAKKWVIANALEPEMTVVPRLLLESAAAQRKQVALRLAEHKKVLLTQIYALP